MDKLLKKAIENELLRRPSRGFSDKVMSQLFELKEKIVYQPLITTKIWMGTAIAFVVIFAVSFVFFPANTGTNYFNFFAKAANFIKTLPLPKIDFFTNINLLIIFGISSALGLLMFFDLILFRKK